MQENVPDNIPESIVVMEAGPSKERYAVLAKRLSLSEDSRIQHLGKRIYAALLESSTDESFNEKRMLKELLEIATGHTNDSEQARKLSDILVCFAGEVPKVARLIVQMAIDDSRKAKGDQANLRSQLEEKAVLSKRLEENSKELKLKMEKVESKLMSEKQLYKEDLHRKNEEYKVLDKTCIISRVSLTIELLTVFANVFRIPLSNQTPIEHSLKRVTKP